MKEEEKPANTTSDNTSTPVFPSNRQETLSVNTNSIITKKQENS